MQELLTCVRIIVHNYRTQHSTEQFWLSSLLSCRQAQALIMLWLDGRGRVRLDFAAETTYPPQINLPLINGS